jgi:hypothetical protein
VAWLPKIDGKCRRNEEEGDGQNEEGDHFEVFWKAEVLEGSWGVEKLTLWRNGRFLVEEDSWRNIILQKGIGDGKVEFKKFNGSSSEWKKSNESMQPRAKKKWKRPLFDRMLEAKSLPRRCLFR